RRVVLQLPGRERPADDHDHAVARAALHAHRALADRDQGRHRLAPPRCRGPHRGHRRRRLPSPQPVDHGRDPEPERLAMKRRDPPEQGSAMLVVATILVALLAGGGIALYLQLQNTKSAGVAKATAASLYCAESGAAVAQGIYTNQYALWYTILDTDTSNDPA